MLKPNQLKKRLKDGEIVTGAWCVIPSAEVISVLGSAGLDFVIIDMEHGAHSFETAAGMIRAAETEGCAPLVRVPQNDEAQILRALDIDAAGVIVPHIESKADAEKAISYAKYHPLGQRGFSPFTRAGRYSMNNVKTHSQAQNKETIVTLILEGKQGIENLDQILSIDNVTEKIDIIYIGAYDLSQAVGFPGQVDHPEVRQYMEECVQKIRNSGIAPGGYVAKNKDDMVWMRDIGMQFITLMPDCTVLYHAYNDLYNDFQHVGSCFKPDRTL
ncbi:HpcH/HpaI aldolase/citrate lyase family protein [Candidatus Margulisiibacteriota bacterium]